MSRTWRAASLATGLALALGFAVPAHAQSGSPARPAPAIVNPDSGLKTYVLVRHAEKDTTLVGHDVPLSMVGRLRARELARVLGAARLHAIYVTPYQRNRQTADPVRERRGDTLVVIDDVPATLRALQAEGWGRTILVVGHSNTLPELIAGLTGRPFSSSEAIAYDGMWVVTVARDGATSLLRLRYGEPSGPAH
jgi:broad specificity phosphatase PhoE